jgi:hypothetical protein
VITMWNAIRDTYSFHDHTILVTHCGRICFKNQKVNVSHVLRQVAVFGLFCR